MGAGPGVIHQALWGAIALPCRASTSPLTWGTGPPLPLLTGEPQASCPACRDWHAFPIHLTGKHHLHHLPARLLGKKRAEKEGLGQWPSSPFMGARGNREAGSQPRTVARKGGFCSCTCWEESKEDLLLQQFLPHTLCPFPHILSSGRVWQPSSDPTSAEGAKRCLFRLSCSACALSWLCYLLWE